MNIFQIREILRAPIGTMLEGRQVTRESKAEAWEERKLYEEAVASVLAKPKLSKSENEWAQVSLEIVRNPHLAVVAAYASGGKGHVTETKIPMFLSSPTQDSLESLTIEKSGVEAGDLVRELFAGAPNEVTAAVNGETCYFELTLETKNIQLILDSYQRR